MLVRKQKLFIAHYIAHYVVKLLNISFHVITTPNEAIEFFYDRLYFTYITDKQTLSSKIVTLEKNFENNKTILYNITRTMVKLNYLLYGDNQLLSQMNIPNIKHKEQKNINDIIIFTEQKLYQLVIDFYHYKSMCGYDLNSIKNYCKTQIQQIVNV